MKKNPAPQDLGTGFPGREKQDGDPEAKSEFVVYIEWKDMADMRQEMGQSRSCRATQAVGQSFVLSSCSVANLLCALGKLVDDFCQTMSVEWWGWSR